jgi:hypothetical protein
MDQEYGKLSRGIGSIISFLGMRITINHSSPIIKVDQSELIKKILNEFGNNKLIKSKYPSDIHLFEDSDCDQYINKSNYLSLVMSLMYLATKTRPDILKEVAWLATKSSRPTIDHLKKLYKVINYLSGTIDHGLIFDGDGDDLELFADASFAVHGDTSGHTGFVIKLFGSIIMAKSMKQRIVTKSSTEAELVALDDAATHIPWIYEFLEELKININPTAIIYQDNKSTITLANNGGGCFKRNKHILNRYFWIHRLIDNDVVKLVYLNTNLMLADLLTKPLVGEHFEMLRDQLVQA